MPRNSHWKVGFLAGKDVSGTPLQFALTHLAGDSEELNTRTVVHQCTADEGLGCSHIEL